MTVSSTSRSAGPFTGNGVTTSFPFTFKVFTKADIEVTRTVTATGAQNVLVLDSDYSVTLNADQDATPGGSITYPLAGSPLPAGETLAAVGNLDATQETDISNAGSFLPNVIEDALDRGVIQVQQLLEKASRAISFPVGDSGNTTLPPANLRAGAAVVFDNAGNAGVSGDIGALALSASTSAAAAATSRAAIDNRIYPGTFAVAPTTRPDGSAIQNGDEYFGTDGFTYLRASGAWVNQTSAAAASATAAAGSATSAAGSASAAATSALDAQAAGGVYDTIALGETATATGKTFLVRQVYGKGAYEYSRTATGSTWRNVVPIGARARDIAYERVIKNTLAPPVAGLTVHLWGQSAWEWDLRLVPNEAAATLPTLNWLPDPFNPLQETGGGTPARTFNTPNTTDPLGGSNAEELTFTSANSQHAFYVSTEPAVPATDIRVRIFTKLLSGGSAFKLGSTSGLSITPGASWDANSLETTIAGYTGSVGIGISTAVGNTAAGLAIAGAGIFDPLAGESASLPSLATMLAAQNAGHMKASLARPGAMTLTSGGSIALDGANGLTPMVYLDVNHTVLSQYSFGCVMNCEAMPVSTSGSAMSFDNHAGVTAGATNAHGQIGVYGATDSVAGRPGRIFMNPAGSVAINQGNAYFPGEGRQTVIVTVDNGTVMLYVNGVPQWLGLAGGWVNPAVARLIFGAYAATIPRRKTGTPFVGSLDGIFFKKNVVLTQAEVNQQDKHMRERLRLYQLSVGPRKVCLIAGGDSLAEFSPSWFWQLGECTQLSPRVHGQKEAAGGTKLRSVVPQPLDWVNVDRYAKLVQRIQAADAAGYDKIDFYILAGANDSIESWINNGYDYRPWKTEFLAYLAGIKALSTKVRIVVLTMLPRPGVGDELLLEQQRQAWNDDVRTNYASMGIDRVIDTGLGTERISYSSVVTAETIAGGTAMGNWRESQAAKTNTRNPAATITLSALSGASFTGTAAAGTFTSADTYRVIVAGAGGEAKITAVSGDGSTVTLSTTNYAPTPWPSEPAAITTRNQITRAPFLSLSLTSGNWTVRQDASTTTRLYQSDGIHPGYPGGRMLAELVWPVTKSLQDPLTGLAL